LLFIYASPLPSAKPQLACPVSAGNPGLTSFPNFQAPFQRAQLVNSPLQQGRIRPPEFHRMLYARQVGWSSEIIAKGPKWVGRIWKCAELSGFPVLEICGSCKRRTTPPPTPHSLDLRIPGEGSDTLIFSPGMATPLSPGSLHPDGWASLRPGTPSGGGKDPV